jgi:hypothetical protein
MIIINYNIIFKINLIIQIRNIFNLKTRNIQKFNENLINYSE